MPKKGKFVKNWKILEFFNCSLKCKVEFSRFCIFYFITMKSRFILFLGIILLAEISFGQKEEVKLNVLINQWHFNAAKSEFKNYFDATSENFIFLGTAPGERWNKLEFQTFCKPYFDKGKAWDFKPSNRKWNFSKDKKTAWFDEDLETWMKGCRGSGICTLEKGEWKIAYYNLTVLIENEKIKKFIELREE